jgi:hypothetical protein
MPEEDIYEEYALNIEYDYDYEDFHDYCVDLCFDTIDIED